MQRHDLGAPLCDELVVGQGELPGAGLDRGDRVARGDEVVEGVGVDVDALEVLEVTVAHGGRHHRNAEPVDEIGWQLRARVGAEPDLRAGRLRAGRLHAAEP